ncbi:mannitol dehydrogenase family protein [Alteromonas sp. C1M14]|uniref:mannitol dehydrogenase family protein n=1 Tax=Alteromonas sp. C1M14 TaxID=2841567 RepID=UPI001C081D33|nr:mannitol dehydrogenase family protein [Alteromonas sp. C1M14]MBU2979289.1 mannitol dehydrogenase family protein [Alteromonas sp. C1M14]
MQPQSCISLSRDKLNQLPEHITVPGYPVEKVTAGIVHVGVGGFHRSHEAMYVDAIMEKTGDLSWGICGVGLREGDRRMQDILAAQDYLYTLIEKHGSGEHKARVIGAMTDFLMASDDPARVIDQMAAKQTKIVSLTITEGGYNFDPTTGNFIANNDDVQFDLANPATPKTVFGFLTAALKQRKAAGQTPFTIMSCDNIQHNGDVLKKMLLSFIRLTDVTFANWVEQNVCFPNSMVDRITPATVDADREKLQEMGLSDGWPVVCEPFHQWIIEDLFSDSRPHWEQVGAQFVPHVAPYEKLKLRMLNAGHSVLGLVGSVAGLDTIHGAMAEPKLRELLSAFMSSEVMPTLDAVDGIDVEEYKGVLLSRFANPYIKDALSRICLESSAKIPVFLLPTIKDNLSANGSVQLSALTLAAWCYYSDKQASEDGKPLQIQDAMADALHQAASGTAEDPLAFLKLESVFGELAQDRVFSQAYLPIIKGLYNGEPVLDIATSLLSEHVASCD